MKPPVEAPASRARRPLDGHRERLEGAEQLVRAAGHPAGLVGVGADDDRRAGIDAGGRLGGGPAADGDPALGDQGDRVLAGAGQATPHELRVESAATGHQSWSIVPSSRCSRACSASKTATCSATGRSLEVRERGLRRLGVSGRRRGPGVAGRGRGRAAADPGPVARGSARSWRSPLGSSGSAGARIAGPLRFGGYRPGTTGTARRTRR